MKKRSDLLTWNGTGVMSSSSYLCDILTQGDIHIFGIAENWLFPNNIHFSGHLSSDFNFHAVCYRDLNILL